MRRSGLDWSGKVLLIGSVAVVLALLCFLIAIWSNDDRFGETGVLFAIPGIAMVVVGGLSRAE